MKFNNITFSLVFIFFLQILSSSVNSENNSYIILKIDNQIITNIDIQNEKKYLLAINQKLAELNEDDAYEVAKESLIREKIKKNELIKYYDIEVLSKFIDGLLKDFYTKLGFQDLNDIEQYLLSKDIKIENVKYKLNIEALWNTNIYNRYNNKVEIDEDKLKEKIEKTSNQKRKEMIFLSEIVFSATSKTEVKETHNKILNSITNIGFNNTANIYSLSQTAKFGGEIGWINANQLSESIYNRLKNLQIGEYTDLINVPSGFLILKIIDKKIEAIEINPEEELKQMVTYEKNRQLNEFSSIYYQKIKKNSLIDDK